MEVTKSNFEEVFPLIKQAIEDADYLSIDTEFTGLRVLECEKPSLFDDGMERYRKLRKCAANFTISQIGLCTFEKCPDRNVYEAHCFNFYLFPRAIGCLDRIFMCQASSLDFLVQHKFNFNKFVYEGISFLNEVEEAEVGKMVETHDIFLGHDRNMDNESLQILCSRVAQWLVSAKDGEKLQLTDLLDIHTFLLHWEIRARFSQVWTEDEEEEECIIVVKVTPEARSKIEMETKQQQGERLKDEMLGFTRVFREIVSSKKVILGHNNWTDLLLMYEKFYRPLPISYNEFKQDINIMFPYIVDTKHLACNFRRPLDDTELLQSTALSSLYKSLSSEKGRTLSLYSPDIVHAAGFDTYETKHCPHEAGYDAFMCGYVFLRLAHLWTTKGVSSTDARPVSLHEYMKKVKPYINSVNLIRAAVDHVCLDKEDPVSRRPAWLIVRSKQASYCLKSSELARLFSTFGSVDIKVNNPKQAFVAVSNHKCAKDILKAFYSHKSIKVARYSIWKHSPVVRAFMWGGVLMTGGICVWTILSSMKVKDS